MVRILVSVVLASLLATDLIVPPISEDGEGEFTNKPEQSGGQRGHATVEASALPVDTPGSVPKTSVVVNPGGRPPRTRKHLGTIPYGFRGGFPYRFP